MVAGRPLIRCWWQGLERARWNLSDRSAKWRRFACGLYRGTRTLPTMVPGREKDLLLYPQQARRNGARIGLRSGTGNHPPSLLTTVEMSALAGRAQSRG